MADHNDIISPVATQRPELTISTPAINEFPVELDATPTSPERLRARLLALKDSAEMTVEEREKRAQLLSERKSDPAVLVDIPQTPGPEELEKSGAVVDETKA